MDECEYAIKRKDLLGNDMYAKCKDTKEDCWTWYDKNRCTYYQNKNPKKIFCYHKGNYKCLQDLLGKK